VDLKGCSVYNWEECVNTLNSMDTVVLDTESMLIPENVKKLEAFWRQFVQGITRAERLKVINFYKCPPTVLNRIVLSLPRLNVFDATTIT